MLAVPIRNIQPHRKQEIDGVRAAICFIEVSAALKVSCRKRQQHGCRTRMDRRLPALIYADVQRPLCSITRRSVAPALLQGGAYANLWQETCDDGAIMALLPWCNSIAFTQPKSAHHLL